MLCPVRLIKLRNVRDQRIVRVGVRQERTNGEQDLANRQCRTPLVLENVQTDTAVRVDVAMVNACRKVDLGRLQERERAQEQRGEKVDSKQPS